MGVPDRLLVHDVTVVHPAPAVNGYGDPVDDWAAATRVPARGWLQQDTRDESHPDGRNPAVQRWRLITDLADIAAGDRVEWAGHTSGPVTFDVDGPPAPLWSPDGYHHLEATLTIVEG